MVLVSLSLQKNHIFFKIFSIVLNFYKKVPLMKKIFLLLSASYLCNAADSENTVIVDSLKNQSQHLSAAAQLWHESNTAPTITVEAAKASLQSHLSGGLPACLLALQKSEVVGMVRVVAGSSKDSNDPDACPRLSS